VRVRVPPPAPKTTIAKRISPEFMIAVNRSRRAHFEYLARAACISLNLNQKAGRGDEVSGLSEFSSRR
jgi:hypothetical protein